MRFGWKTFLTVVCCGALTACASNNGSPSAETNQGGRDLFAAAKQPSQGTMTDASRLPAYHWQLQTVQGADQAWYDKNKAALRAPLQLSFQTDGPFASIAGLCNTVNVGYETLGQTMLMRAGIRTMMACQDTRLMELEDRVANALVGVKSWQWMGTAETPQLALTFANGSVWSLQGLPTDATRFGGPAEQIFLEVAAKTRSCNDGLRTRECLEVRRVEFDQQGLRKGAGPWELFYGDIEGFSHIPGERSVLRVNRYERKNPPADASRYAYVLDMRVSTEIAR